MNYNSYHSSFKEAVAFGLLPSEIEQTIPGSTRHRFKKTDFSKFYGYEHVEDFQQSLHITKEILQYKKVIKLFKAALYLRDKKLQAVRFFKNQKDKARQVIVAAISRVKDTLSLKRAVRFFSISTKTFYNWKNALKHKCEDSVFNNCVKR